MKYSISICVPMVGNTSKFFTIDESTTFGQVKRKIEDYLIRDGYPYQSDFIFFDICILYISVLHCGAQYFRCSDQAVVCDTIRRLEYSSLGKVLLLYQDARGSVQAHKSQRRGAMVRATSFLMGGRVTVDASLLTAATSYRLIPPIATTHTRCMPDLLQHAILEAAVCQGMLSRKVSVNGKGEAWREGFYVLAFHSLWYLTPTGLSPTNSGDHHEPCLPHLLLRLSDYNVGGVAVNIMDRVTFLVSVEAAVGRGGTKRRSGRKETLRAKSSDALKQWVLALSAYSNKTQERAVEVVSEENANMMAMERAMDSHSVKMTAQDIDHFQNYTSLFTALQNEALRRNFITYLTTRRLESLLQCWQYLVDLHSAQPDTLPDMAYSLPKGAPRVYLEDREQVKVHVEGIVSHFLSPQSIIRQYFASDLHNTPLHTYLSSGSLEDVEMGCMLLPLQRLIVTKLQVVFYQDFLALREMQRLLIHLNCPPAISLRKKNTTSSSNGQDNNSTAANASNGQQTSAKSGSGGGFFGSLFRRTNTTSSSKHGNTSDSGKDVSSSKSASMPAVDMAAIRWHEVASYRKALLHPTTNNVTNAMGNGSSSPLMRQMSESSRKHYPSSEKLPWFGQWWYDTVLTSLREKEKRGDSDKKSVLPLWLPDFAANRVLHSNSNPNTNNASEDTAHHEDHDSDRHALLPHLVMAIPPSSSGSSRGRSSGDTSPQSPSNNKVSLLDFHLSATLQTTTQSPNDSSSSRQSVGHRDIPMFYEELYALRLHLATLHNVEHIPYTLSVSDSYPTMALVLAAQVMLCQFKPTISGSNKRRQTQSGGNGNSESPNRASTNTSSNSGANSVMEMSMLADVMEIFEGSVNATTALQYATQSALLQPPCLTASDSRYLVVLEVTLGEAALVLLHPHSNHAYCRVRLGAGISVIKPLDKHLHAFSVIETDGSVWTFQPVALDEGERRHSAAHWLRMMWALLSPLKAIRVHYILKGGFLRKKGKFNTQYQLRYFQLTSDLQLRYFKEDGGGGNGRYKGHIDLLDLHRGDNVTFNSVTSELQNDSVVRFGKEIILRTRDQNGRTWQLRAEEESEAEDWIRVIVDVLQLGPSHSSSRRSSGGLMLTAEQQRDLQTQWEESDEGEDDNSEEDDD